MSFCGTGCAMLILAQGNSCTMCTWQQVAALDEAASSSWFLLGICKKYTFAFYLWMLSSLSGEVADFSPRLLWRLLKYFICITTISSEKIEEMLPITQGWWLLERFVWAISNGSYFALRMPEGGTTHFCLHTTWRY